MAFPLQFLLETVLLPQLLMGKDKKKHPKKDKGTDNILDVAALSIKKFRKVTKQIGKLSTGQKLVGGIALVAAGLTYLAQQEADAAPKTPAAPLRLPEASVASDADTLEPAPHKSRKSARPKPAADE